MVQFIDFLPAIHIQPDDDRPAIAFVSAEGCIREEHTAVPLGNAPDPALVVTPVELKPERIYVILGGLLDIANRNLWNRLGKVRQHVPQLTPIWRKTRPVFVSRDTGRAEDGLATFASRSATVVSTPAVPSGVGTGHQGAVVVEPRYWR